MLDHPPCSQDRRAMQLTLRRMPSTGDAIEVFRNGAVLPNLLLGRGKGAICLVQVSHGRVPVLRHASRPVWVGHSVVDFWWVRVVRSAVGLAGAGCHGGSPRSQSLGSFRL